MYLLTTHGKTHISLLLVDPTTNQTLDEEKPSVKITWVSETSVGNPPTTIDLPYVITRVQLTFLSYVFLLDSRTYVLLNKRYTSSEREGFLDLFGVNLAGTPNQANLAA